jgi:ferredoxin--NADP+ reductase
MGELQDCDVRVLREEVELDALSREQLERSGDKAVARKVEVLRGFAARPCSGKARLLTFRFLVSPVELLGDAGGRVRGMKLVRNRLAAGDGGAIKAVPTEFVEELPVELVFRSVGYRGVPLADVPFDEKSGTIPNLKGRVLHPVTLHPVPGLYVAGWIKRGPTGIIGTNKPDAAETADAMIEDLRSGAAPAPAESDPAAIERLLRERQPCLITFDDWKMLDRIESERGRADGRPRIKMTEAEIMAKLGCT